MRVRNGGPGLGAALDGPARWCDDIYVVDDRSTDGTAEVLCAHPRVTNVVHARAGPPDDPWPVPESRTDARLDRTCKADVGGSNPSVPTQVNREVNTPTPLSEGPFP
ncbi:MULTISPECIES: hypothetical protein [unclassified Streptomyces]|uniref:hypothetical protein n=1 Tax=unclassified Streptomyces TaxID=2593676 RepID=UPI0033C0716A